MDHLKRLPWYVAGLMLLIGVAFYLFHNGFTQFINQGIDAFATGEVEEIQQFLEPYKSFGFLVIIAAFVFQLFLIIAPSLLLIFLAVVMYGPWWGSVVALVGSVLASVVAYYLGRTLSDVTIDRIFGRKSRKKTTFYVKRYGFWTIFLSRISPILSSDLLSLVAGLLRMRLGPFLLATVIGIVPLIALLAYAGQDNQSLLQGLYIATGIAVASFVVYIIVDVRLRKRDKEK